MPLSGQFPFGQSLFGSGMYAAPVYLQDALVFDDFSLSDGEEMVLSGLRISGAERELATGNVPRRDGKFIITDQLTQYEIEAVGYAKQPTAAALDAFIDTIKKNLRAQGGALDYTDAGGTVRRFVATLVNTSDLFPIRTGGNAITRIPWNAVFHCYEPFPTSRDYVSSLKNVTVSVDTDIVNNGGSAPARTVFAVVANAASSVTVVNVANDTTGEQIQYTGAIATGDSLVFDGERLTVTKNGVRVAFTGSFPRLEPDDNQIRFTITGSSFDLDCTTKFKVPYL